jgi:hypothetical protein
MDEQIVIFDIDGTPADVSERIHHLQRKSKNWKGFFRDMAQDKAIKSIVRLCNILYSSSVRVVLCSKRSEEHRSETVKWLAKQGVNYHELRLRWDGERHGDVMVKREMLAGIDKSKVLFCC